MSDHKVFDPTSLQLLRPKQILERLPIALAQASVVNTSEKLLNEIPQIKYSLYKAKEMTKKVHDNIMNSIKLQNGMDTIFMNSENCKTSESHRLSLNLADKINLKTSG